MAQSDNILDNLPPLKTAIVDAYEIIKEPYENALKEFNPNEKLHYALPQMAMWVLYLMNKKCEEKPSLVAIRDKILYAMGAINAKAGNLFTLDYEKHIISARYARFNIKCDAPPIAFVGMGLQTFNRKDIPDNYGILSIDKTLNVHLRDSARILHFLVIYVWRELFMKNALFAKYIGEFMDTKTPIKLDNYQFINRETDDICLLMYNAFYDENNKEISNIAPANLDIIEKGEITHSFRQ